jgi:hypothetical protein
MLSGLLLMYVFFYMLAAMGIAYWAKLGGRNPLLWFAASVMLTPIGGSVALMIADKYRR